VRKAPDESARIVFTDCISGATSLAHRIYKDGCRPEDLRASFTSRNLHGTWHGSQGRQQRHLSAKSLS
jgi:hypothetical protein